MTRRPFDPEELDHSATSEEGAITELQRYAMASDTDAPRGLSERIMAAIEQEPAPRRGFLAWLTGTASPGTGPGRFVRVGAIAATLVLAVAGALFAGQLADLIRDVGSGDASPTPTVSPSPSGTPSSMPSPSLSEAPTPSATPEGSDDHGGSGGLPTAQPTPPQTAAATAQDTPEETKTPRPSPTSTASPSATPTQTP